MLEKTPCKVRNAYVEIFHFKKNLIILDGRLQSSTSDFLPNSKDSSDKKACKTDKYKLIYADLKPDEE